VTFQSNNLEDTQRFAADLAARLQPGDCVALEGEMGAGKTTLVRSLVQALGGNPRDVSSPTFTLLNIYDTPRCKVFHLDAYRVSGADDFEAIGFEELLDQSGIVLVEWPSVVEDLIPASAVRVKIAVAGESGRAFTLDCVGSDEATERRSDEG
jgi:tRNA threonylcarbamoyl adenosine modification protein YjeE